MSRDHVIYVSREFVEWVSLILSHHPAMFGLHRLCKCGNVIFFYLSHDHDIEVSREFVDGVHDFVDGVSS